MQLKNWQIILLILTLPIVFYFSSINYFFSQDDFIHISASQISNLKGFLNFFNPSYSFPDIFFYRPLSTQLYFFLNLALFGFNPLPFHLEALFFHGLNTILFYFLIKKIWKEKFLSLIAALFYGISAVHFLSLFYISAFQEILRSFYFFLALFCFFNHQDNKKLKWLVFSLVCFILSLLSKETSIIFPLLIIPLEVLRRKQKEALIVLKSLILPLAAYFGIVVGYLVARLAGFQSIFSEGNYSFSFSLINIFQNLKWYMLWSFGLPEILASYPSLKPGSLIQFSKDSQFGLVILIFFALLLSLIILRFIVWHKFSLKELLLSAAIFIFSLSPVLVLNNHKYPQYLDLAFLAFLPFIIKAFFPTGISKNIFSILFVLSFLALQFFSLRLTEITHWTTHRANVAEYYFKSLKKDHPNLKDTRLIFHGTDEAIKQLSFALAIGYGPLVWYPNQLKEVEYLNLEAKLPSGLIIPVTKY